MWLRIATSTLVPVMNPCLLFLLILYPLMARAQPIDHLDTSESFGALGGLKTYNPGYNHGHLGSLAIGDIGYDDLHKYGGIGKKANIHSLYDHGLNGYKNYYGDSGYANQGLNKYSKDLQSDHIGSKTEGHTDYHGGHHYTRNRGYGYEKHYMYDKEYSSGKHGGSHGGHHSYYGDHDKDAKYSINGYKNYAHNKVGDNSGHSSHGHGKYGHLLDDHSEHLLKHNLGHHKKHLEHHLDHQPYLQKSPHESYIPVIESYGGALGHSSYPMSPTYGFPASYQSHINLPSHEDAIYVPSASDSNRDATEGESINTHSPKVQVKPMSALSVVTLNTAPLISTKLAPVTSPPLFSATLTAPSTLSPSEFKRVSSAVHATPPVISTNSALSYYNN